MSQERQSRTTVGQEKFFNPMLRFFSQLDRLVFRLTGTSLLRLFGKGAPTMLLTTIGRKSGKPRTTPVLYLRDGEQLVIVASKGGAPQHPGWYRNLSKDPEVEVQVKDDVFPARAHTAEGGERDRLWRLALGGVQLVLDREIPVVVLERSS